ncbi:MAG: hypothetical protein HY544_01360 [Candidatus Diapherotrites archaeon]|uniref:50S ribosomal protein L32e n=1 Tax=Candidatus Iainarchaeum sp. TaxID=3101447 RepID=A0A8T3YKC6_9ARCH|nr:hypothetical protein [Candidatus Diapherotrites archaeon]
MADKGREGKKSEATPVRRTGNAIPKPASEWEKHMEKKPQAKTSAHNTEIQRPEKKKPIEGKKVAAPEKKIVEGKHAAHENKAGQKQADAKGKKEAGTHAEDKKPKEAHEGHAAQESHAHEGHKHAAPETKETRAAAESAKGKNTDKKTAKKVKQKSRKTMVKRSEAVLAMREASLGSPHLPTFRGRFGKRSIRRKSIAKWNRWRVPRGIDVKRVISDGYMPRTGYATPKEYRHVHPSGYREYIVRTLSDVSATPKDHAIRVAAGIGSRKKVTIVDKAIEKGIRVLNP